MNLTKPLQIANLVRDVRRQLNLSQEKFAEQLGVCFKTVNRWENGHTMPSPMALKLIENQLQQMGKPGKVLLSQYFSKSK